MVKPWYRLTRRGGAIGTIVRVPFHVATCYVVRESNWLVGTIGADPHKVEVIHNGIPLDAAAPRHRQNHPDAYRWLLFLHNPQDATGLLGVIARLPVTIGQSRLTVPGADTKRRKAEAKTLGLADRVTCPGQVEQAVVRSLLTKADVSLRPHEEGLPLVVLGALRSGAPVLCTPVGALFDQGSSLARFSRKPPVV